jgi:hypothetical protein
MLIMAIQTGVGALLSHWPAVGSHYPAAAHLSAWGTLVAAQILSAIWYFYPPAAQRAQKHAAPGPQPG